MKQTLYSKKDKIILKSNVHKSVINALIISGTILVYINLKINTEYGIPIEISISSLKHIIEENSDVKTIFVNNQTYFEICSNFEKIIIIKHKNNMSIMVNEAHGTYFILGKICQNIQ
ncbi:MAG: hypothetical protein LBJ09_02660 [Clostridiales bacterium]|nr:hypothetical protein [Clostridiales bacterium]